jgi:hypothetical protein
MCAAWKHALMTAHAAARQGLAAVHRALAVSCHVQLAWPKHTARFQRSSSAAVCCCSLELCSSINGSSTATMPQPSFSCSSPCCVCVYPCWP